jgi:hypothetical protein
MPCRMIHAAVGDILIYIYHAISCLNRILPDVTTLALQALEGNDYTFIGSSNVDARFQEGGIFDADRWHCTCRPRT